MMQARDDLKKVLKETQQKSRKEIEKMQQYQDILLKENEAVSKQLLDHQRELAAKVSECDGFSVTNSHLQNELTVLKLQLEDLKGYKAKYESAAATTLKSQETQLQELHAQAEEMAASHAQTMQQVQEDKETLIQQNSQLKQALSDSMAANEQLKSQVESFHGKLVNCEA